jgi:hypothetical protein
VFMLSWDSGDDWNVHLAAPTIRHTSDGVQCPLGPQVPLLMFGGPVAAVMDARRNLSRRRHQHRPPAVRSAGPRAPMSTRTLVGPTWSATTPSPQTRTAPAGARVPVPQVVAMQGAKDSGADLALVRLRRPRGITEGPQ